MSDAIGIDLGTTYSCVARVKSDTVVEVFENLYGNKITPSVVHIGKMGKEVGEEAQAQRATDPANTIFQIKRFMGRAITDAEIKKRPFPFEIVPTAKGDAAIRVTPAGCDSKIYCPEEISGFILKYMAVLAREKMGAAPDVKIDAVITVPANFNNTQRQATKDAGELAGLNVLRIINEPTAAALAYGFGSNSEKKRIVLVYDLGGGTFDVSIVRSQKLGGKVLSTEGVTDLGGEDFDRRLYEFAYAEFKGRGITVAPDEEFGLYKSCEEAKVTLSTRERATIRLFKNGESKTCEITRSAFEELCIDLFEKTIECMDKAISESGVDKASIDDVVLVGGSSRIPKVRQMVRDHFGNRELKFNIPPDHAVACGAAILAASLSSETPSCDVNQESAASPEQHNSLRGAVRLADVLPFSLGTNVAYDRFSRILKKNKQYPISNTRSYSNGGDNHTEMVFMILEGESARYTENKLLGVCTIPIPQKNIGENTVLGTYSVDENGILSVHLRDLDTDEKASTKVQTSRLSEEERMLMVRNARLEEENEQIERDKYDARSSFADAMMNVKASVHKTDSTKKKVALLKLAEIEEKWIETTTNPPNEDLLAHASTIKLKLAAIMKP